MRINTYVQPDFVQSYVLSWQRPAKVIRIAQAHGHAFLVSVEHNSIARWIRLRFHTGLTILMRPRDLVVDGEVITDDLLTDFLQNISEET